MRKEPMQKGGLPARGPRVWNWNVGEVKKLGVLYEASLNELHMKVSSQLPDGRKVREIIGSLEDPDPTAGDPLMIPIVTTHIRSDDKLDAFLHLTEARPIKLLIVLYRDPAVRANSPSPAGCNTNTYYFNLGRFDGPEYYIDEIEDSEEEVTRKTRVRRGVPRKDHKFEESLEAYRRRIRRQEQVLADLEGKHKAVFPNAIYESNAGGGLCVLCYGKEDELTGKQVVQFRAVVADYVKDLVARMVANTAAGGGLTNRQLVYHKRRHEEKGIYSVRFASLYVENIVISTYEKGKKEDIIKYIREMEQNNKLLSSKRGFIFEAVAYCILRRGRVFEIRCLEYLIKKKLPLPATTLQIFHTIGEIKPVFYYRPYSKTFESIDALHIGYGDYNELFQIMVGKQHSIKVNGLENIKAKLTKKVYLYFVIPNNIYSNFINPQNYLNLQGQKHQKIPKWINNMEQWALRLNYITF
ncbi:hypothetical protein L211DRAFT_853208 [Terfezia boudieri ATCC MYA-4762]|uniref:Uncharacterized protein n=1 Tax=Terfezia boudieri ATCC MYA-4762 TaxID=1051890 RepID=A0A3N4LD43_9PEZI|nr:hypothetical protein L211DRAFT_853208 [Terfezia boudieri ATCC MYA-4762]